MTTRRMSATICDKTPLYEGFLKIYRYEIEIDRHAGGTERSVWEIMERGNAVAVLGHDPKRDEVVLGNEFRPGALLSGDYPFRDNLVAGAIEPNEDPLAAAVREMQEEAGLTLHNPVLIQPGAYVSSGGTTEKIFIVYGTVDTSLAGGVHGAANEREDILSVVLPTQVFIDRVRSGDINDLKTVVAAYWLAERRSTPR